MAELKTFLFTDICRSVDLKNEMVGRSVTERDLAFIQSILTPHRERIEEQIARNTGGRWCRPPATGISWSSTIRSWRPMWAVGRAARAITKTRSRPPAGARSRFASACMSACRRSIRPTPDNFVGKSVDYASRLNDYATGGQILVSRSVMAILDDVGLGGNLVPFARPPTSQGDRPRRSPRAAVRRRAARAPCGSNPPAIRDRQWTVIPTVGFDGPAAEAPRIQALPLQPLKRVGNYELEELLGSGGMGDVYKGRHTPVRSVAGDQSDQAAVCRRGQPRDHSPVLPRDQGGRALEHKNIVVAIDSSAPDDRIHYLVMEYIDGVALHDLVDQHGPLSVADACEIIRQAARGLQYIHRNDMVHRDIKPSNLMLTLVDRTTMGREPHSDFGRTGRAGRGVS